MPFEWFVALRFLREGRAQTALILAGIGVGVGVVVFLSALINGLQDSLIDKTLGNQPHVVVRVPDDVVRPQVREEPGKVLARRIQPPPQRIRFILDGARVLSSIERQPRVLAAAAVVSGPGTAVRGTASASIVLKGVEAQRYQRIISMGPRIVSGLFRTTGSDAAIGTELARKLGLSVGDKLRIKTAREREDVFLVSGIFDVGNRDLNERWVFVSLRAAQTLLDLPGGVSSIEVKVDRIFEAESVAAAVSAETGLEAESWMKLNRQLLVGLRSQNASSHMIQFFVAVAVALGIASVLVVSVVQKSKEIGILRAMGTPARLVTRVFLLQGGLLGLVGSAVGVALGTGLALGFASLAKNADGSATFPVALNLGLFARTAAGATLTGVLAAVAPARRASRLDPAEVIRYG